MRFCLMGALVVLAGHARAGETPEQAMETPCSDYPRRVAIETNVLWPIFPGGISELRVMVPLVRKAHRDFRGELVAGTYTDFATRVVRESGAGKVSALDAKVGWRQFFVYGLHLELDVNFGWRHEDSRPDGRAPTDAFVARLFAMAGWQYDFTRRFYANVRGGLGINLVRTDPYGYTEKFLVPAVDLNVGVRL